MDENERLAAIGHRAYEELKRIAGPRGIARLCRRMGYGRKSAYKWGKGHTPTIFALVKLHYAGADVMYILSGERRGDDGGYAG